jgi:hypothetical protein
MDHLHQVLLKQGIANTLCRFSKSVWPDIPLGAVVFFLPLRTYFDTHHQVVKTFNNGKHVWETQEAKW